VRSLLGGTRCGKVPVITQNLIELIYLSLDLPNGPLHRSLPQLPRLQPRNCEPSTVLPSRYSNMRSRPIQPAGINAQRLHLPSIRVDAESAVSHAEGAILAGKFLQTIAHVHVSARRAVLGAHG